MGLTRNIWQSGFLLLALVMVPTWGSAEKAGYKVGGQSALGFTLGDGNPADARMVISLGTIDDCQRLAGGSVTISALCDKMSMQGLPELALTGQLTAQDARTYRGDLRLADGSLSVPVRVMVQGSQIPMVMIDPDGQSLQGLLTGAGKAEFDRVYGSGPAPMQARSAFRRGKHAEGELSLSPQGNGYAVTFRMDGKADVIDYEIAANDCYEAFSASDQSWFRQCEKTTKDGAAFAVSGFLAPIQGSTDSFSGEVVSADGFWRWQLMVLDPESVKIGVALTLYTDPGFNAPYKILDFAAATGALNSGQTVLEITNDDWRLAQERSPDVGLDLELGLSQVQNGYQGTGVAWFRAQTDQISGYCPNTFAMSQVCEKAQKDGPTEFTLSLTDAAGGDTFGWSGQMTLMAEGAAWRSYPVDLYQGDAITDWGDQDPAALYLRIRDASRNPETEDMAWMLLEPAGRTRISLAALLQQGTLDRPGVATASCDALRESLSALNGTPRMADATVALTDAGFWGGIVPDEADACDRAMVALADAGLTGTGGATSAAVGPYWPEAGMGFVTLPVGSQGEQIEFGTEDGRAVLRVPSMSICTLQDRQLCADLVQRAGSFPVALVFADTNSFGWVQIGSNRYGVLMQRGANGQEWTVQMHPWPETAGVLRLGTRRP